MTYKVKSGGVRGFLRRNSNTISLSVIALSIIAVFLMQALTIAKLQEEMEHQTEVIDSIAEIATQIDQNAQERSRQIDGIDRHLDCIVYFFSQKDRSQKAIDDIEQCRITANETLFYYSQPQPYPPASSNTTPSTEVKRPTVQPQPPQNPQTPPREGIRRGLVPSLNRPLEALNGILRGRE